MMKELMSAAILPKRRSLDKDSPNVYECSSLHAFCSMRRKVYAIGRSHMAGYGPAHGPSASPFNEETSRSQTKQFSLAPLFGSFVAHVVIPAVFTTMESGNTHVSSVTASDPATKYIVPSGTSISELSKLERSNISVTPSDLTSNSKWGEP